MKRALTLFFLILAVSVSMFIVSCGGNGSLGTETVDSISITTQPTRTSYYTGEVFDTAGMVVTVTYPDGEVAEVTNYSVEKIDSLTPEVKAVHIYYGGKVASVAVSVSDIELTSVTDARRTSAGTEIFVDAVFVGKNSGGFVVKGARDDSLALVSGTAPTLEIGARLRFLATAQSDKSLLLASEPDFVTSFDSPVTETPESVQNSVAKWSKMQSSFVTSSVTFKPGTMVKLYGERFYIVKSGNDYILHMNESASALDDIKTDGTRVVKIECNDATRSVLDSKIQTSNIPGKSFSGEIYAVLLGYDADSFDISIVDPSWLTLEDVLTENQKTVKEVAYAFYYKGSYIHYDQYGTRRNINPSPELATATNRIHLDCSSYVNAIYYEAFGENIMPYPTTERSPQTGVLTNYAEEFLGINSDVIGYWDLTTLTTDADREEFVEYVKSVLEVGDVIINRRTSDTGHAIIYVGDGYFLHSTGSSYEYTDNPADAFDRGEAKGTISLLSYKNVLENKNSSRYILASNNNRIAILRPLNRTLTKTENTEARMSISGLSVEKNANLGPYASVKVGDVILYTVTLKNNGKSTLSNLYFSDTIPEGTVFVAASTGVILEQGVLHWSGELLAGATTSISYVLKVTAPVGSLIESDTADINGLKINPVCHTVSGFTAESEAALIAQAEAIAEAEKSYDDPILLINELYPDFFDGASAIAILDELINSEAKCLNTESELFGTVNASLWGGYSVRTTMRTDNIRTRLVTENNLSVGDLIVCEYGDETVGEAKTTVFVYLGEGRLLTASTEAKTAKIIEIADDPYKNELVTLIAYDRFAVIRPSQK